MDTNENQKLTQDVLEHANVVTVISNYIEVIRKGNSCVALCPFHDDKHPSMNISEKKQIWKCFSCGTAGDAIRFVQLYTHCSFAEARKKVAEICGYHDPRLEASVITKKVDNTLEPLQKCLDDLTAYYRYALNTEEGKVALDYFNKRNLDAKIRDKFLLGYAFKDGKSTVKFLESKGHSLKTIELIGIAQGNLTTYTDANAGRVIFPLCNADGQVVGYSARRLNDKEDTPKYVNSPETKLFNKSKTLYNYHRVKDDSRRVGYCYVLEGFMDVFALEKAGISSAIALMGTAFTEDHIKLLRALGCELRICLDGDMAGQSHEVKIFELLKDSGIPFRFVDSMGNERDPDEILNEDGPDALKAYLNNLLSPVDFLLSYYTRSEPPVTLEAKKNLVLKFVPIMKNCTSRLEFDDYLRKLVNITKFDADSIRDLIQRSKNKNKDDYQAQMVNFHPVRKALRRFELAEREILYQMMHNPAAIDFYEAKIESFYDDVYRRIADYILDLHKKNPESISINEIISTINESGDPGGSALIDEVTAIDFEKNHIKGCDEEMLNSFLETINEEKQKLYDDMTLKKALEGKSDIEQARIIADFNKRKLLREGKKYGKETRDEEGN